MLDTILDPANETLASSSGTGKVFDSEHSDDSTSDIDISALLNHVDQKLSAPPVDSVKGVGAGGSGWSVGGPGGGGLMVLSPKMT